MQINLFYINLYYFILFLFLHLRILKGYICFFYYFKNNYVTMFFLQRQTRGQIYSMHTWISNGHIRIYKNKFSQFWTLLTLCMLKA